MLSQTLRREAGMNPTFERDPLGWLDDAARDGRGVRWMSRRSLCIYDAEVARALLRNDGGRMVEHSDFFGSGALAPTRETQVALSRQALALVHDHVQSIDCQPFVSALGQRSQWPRAGNALLREMMRPVLAASERSPAFHQAIDTMIEAQIFGRHEPALGLVRRVRNRFRFYRTVVGEANGGERKSAGAPDLLDVVRRHGREIDEKALVQFYVGFVFATVGSIGFALGWALHQAFRHQKTEHHPAHLVLEALRLFPIAWLFERRVREPDVILGNMSGPRSPW